MSDPDKRLKEWADEQMRKKPVEQVGDNPILDSLRFVVDMMNGGNANPEDVYPRGRYQGD